MPDRPPASVIIVVFNGRQYLDDCLSSVIAQLQLHDEIILVDNNSTDGSPDFIAGRFPQVTLIRQPQNGGFAQGAAQLALPMRLPICSFFSIKIRLSPPVGLKLCSPLSTISAPV